VREGIVHALDSTLTALKITATPWPTPTPMGASNLDAILDEGTLTIGWVGPALLGILIAAFGWAGRVFEWLWSLATWLFSGGMERRGRGVRQGRAEGDGGRGANGHG
jgi:hypothetical protein